jgi:GT2 family glycosyltransferase
MDDGQRVIHDLRQELETASATQQQLRAQLEELRTSRWRLEIRLEGRARQLERLLEIQEHKITALESSNSWRITRPMRAVTTWLIRSRPKAKKLLNALRPSGSVERAAILRRVLGRKAAGVNSGSSISTDYAEWYGNYQTLSAEDIALIQAHVNQQAFSPVHVMWALPAANAVAVHAAVDSLRAQLLPNWTADLLLSPDVTTSGDVSAQVSADHRVRAIREVAEFRRVPDDVAVVVIDRPGRLEPHSLYLLMEAERRLDGSSVVLADEDELDAEDNYQHPRMVGRYSPELPTTGSVALFSPRFRSATHPPVDAFRRGLRTMVHARASQEAAVPAHVPFVIFHAAQSPRLEGAEDHAMLAGGKAEVPFISIIIPTRDRFELMEPCISSILEKTDYPRTRYEIVVVDNGSTESDLLHYLDQLAKDREIRLLKDPRSFNYARLNNLAVAATNGELLAFVNNDVVVHDPAWLRRLAFHAMKPTVGAVGAKLLYPDMTVQHGGVVLGVQGVAAHAHHNLAADAPGYLGLSNTTHAISAVTGACLMIRRRLFDDLGGFNEDLAVAFNDTLLCMDALASGARNVYVHQPALIHFESKSRGLDDTDAKKALFRREARYARSRYRDLFKSDPYYSDNLSFERTYQLAYPPRTFKPWHAFRRQSSGRMRVLILSITHQIGHGVAVVVDIHARHLASLGHDVILGGPFSASDFAYPGCRRAILDSPQQAAIYAVQHGVDCVIMHTPPYYSTMRWLGTQIKTLAYDHGEPPPELFPDAEARNAELDEKAFCLEMADALYANSEATRDESGHDNMGVIPLGNTHLAQWDGSMVERRAAVRTRLGFDDSTIVVLNVCRFHAAERYYKGIDEYCAVRDRLLNEFHEIGERFVFVLVGKGTAKDVQEMEQRGLRVFANVTDVQMLDMYCCADVYANFSRWEGYNLGIGQALAMGLGVVASDIPVHRTFPIFTASETSLQAAKIVELGLNPPQPRQAAATPWEHPLEMLEHAVNQLCFGSTAA